MKNRKLVFFSALPPFRGGIAQFSTRLLSEIEKSFTVKAFTFKSQYPNWLFPGKTQYVKPDSKFKHFERIASTFNPLTFFTSLRKIEKEKPSVFMVNYWMTFMSPMMVFWAKRLPKDTLKVAIVHNFIPHENRFFDKFFNKWFVQKFDLFIALSLKVERDILEVYPSANVLHIPHPAYDHFQPPIESKIARKILNLPDEKHTLLFFGIIRDYKGLDILIRSFSQLPSSYQLLIAGEVYGSDEEYRMIIQQSKNQNIIFVNEFIPDDDVHLYFSAADLCVLPYRSGTQSGVKAIADQMLVPTLVSNVGGIAEKICDKQDGFILKELKVDVLKDYIESIFMDCSLQNVKKQLEIKEQNANDSWKIFAKKLTEKIDHILR